MKVTCECGSKSVYNERKGWSFRIIWDKDKKKRNVEKVLHFCPKCSRAIEDEAYQTRAKENKRIYAGFRIKDD